MNIKTIIQAKHTSSIKCKRTSSQINIHKPPTLYSLDFEEYEKKNLFRDNYNCQKSNNCLHYKDFMKEALMRKELKKNYLSHLFTGSSITAKTTKMFSGNNSPRNQSIEDNNTEHKNLKTIRNDSGYYHNNRYENNDKAKTMNLLDTSTCKLASKHYKHQARSVTRFASTHNNDNMNFNKTFISVYCRIRPLNTLEKMHTKDKVCINLISETQLEIINNNNVIDTLSQYYSFDEIFPTSCTQEEIFNKTSKSIIDSVLQGYNGTIMAYGQTSSGKTFTIQGEKSFPNGDGIIPRAIKHIFLKTSQEPNTFEITASFLEIYMEKINDLFNPSHSNLQIQDDANKKTHIIDLTEIPLLSYELFLKTYKKASRNRTTSLTEMNDYSSRSHCIMILNIYNKNTQHHGKLYIVDLAGSEKISKTNCQGLNVEEAKIINKSLSQLGLIIKALTMNSSHISYRASKLTRLLSESLGGNSKTSLILTCSPSLYNINETLSTLRFGKRAKMIRNKPVINKEESKEDLKYKIELLEKEIQIKNEIIKNIQCKKKESDVSINCSNNKAEHTMNKGKVVESCEGLVNEVKWNDIERKYMENNESGDYGKASKEMIKTLEENNVEYENVNGDKNEKNCVERERKEVGNKWNECGIERNSQSSFSIGCIGNESKNCSRFEIDSQNNNNTILSSYNKVKSSNNENIIQSDRTLNVNFISNDPSSSSIDFNLMKYSLLFLIFALLLYYLLQDYI